jgi:hypothetical protein
MPMIAPEAAGSYTTRKSPPTAVADRISKVAPGRSRSTSIASARIRMGSSAHSKTDKLALI